MAWEYQVVEVDRGTLAATLQGLGREGWELVQVLAVQADNAGGSLSAFPEIAILKRPITL